MSTSTIQSDINAVYNTQQSNQFGTQRYELMFEPGTYNVSVPVGFYTEVVGLGQNPTQTVITGGGIYANAAWNDGNATENFWRGVENITIDPSSGSTEWAVSQADPMRRVQIDGNLVLDDDTSGNTAKQLVVRRLHQRLDRHRSGQLRHPAAVHHAQRPARQLDRLELEHGVRR